MWFSGMKLVKVVAVLLVGVVGWWLFAPETLGGSDTYVVVSGPSMWPRLVTGDLVVLRSAGAYHTGEIAGYKTPQLQAPILHQIIATSGGRFTFKGIHNSFVDPSHPTRSEIVGRMWLDLGQSGRLLRLVQLPAAGGVLLFAAAAYAWWPRRRRRHHRLGRIPYG